MKIAQYLIELLYNRDAVILPGFGEFYVTPGDVTVSKKGKLTPPAKILNFNPSVKANDYVLAKFVAEKESVSITQGNEVIKKFVDDITGKLQTHNEVFIDGLGKFFFQSGDQNVMMFNLDTTHSFDPASFGLISAFAHEVSDEQPEITPESTDSSHKKDVVKETEDEALIVINQPEPKPRKRKYIWLIFLVILLTAGATIAYIFRDLATEYIRIAGDKITSLISSSDQTPAPESPVEQPSVKEIPAIDHEDTLTLPEESSVVVTEEVPNEISSKIPEKTELNSAQDDKHIIVAGCFGDKANAERMVEKLIAEGFTQAAINGKTSSGLLRVVAGFYSSNEEAWKVLNKAKSENKLKNAWISKH